MKIPDSNVYFRMNEICDANIRIENSFEKCDDKTNCDKLSTRILCSIRFLNVKSSLCEKLWNFSLMALHTQNEMNPFFFSLGSQSFDNSNNRRRYQEIEHTKKSKKKIFFSVWDDFFFFPSLSFIMHLSSTAETFKGCFHLSCYLWLFFRSVNVSIDVSLSTLVSHVQFVIKFVK